MDSVTSTGWEKKFLATCLCLVLNERTSLTSVSSNPSLLKSAL